MEYIIDTHVCIWAVGNYNKLSIPAKAIIEYSANKIIVSRISLYEIAVKLSTGKLPEFIVSIDEFIQSIYDIRF